MGAERKARLERRKAKAVRKEMEAVILAARAQGADEMTAVAEYISRQTGVPVEKCLSEVRTWLQPHLSPASSPSASPAL